MGLGSAGWSGVLGLSSGVCRLILGRWVVLGVPGSWLVVRALGGLGGGLETAVWVIKSGSVWLLEVWGLGLGSGVWCLLGLTR